MTPESAIEEKLKEAMARGEFDNLPGTGKPLDLEAYFNTPADLRMAFAILKSNEFVPVEVEIFKEIGEFEERIRSCSDDDERATLNALREERRLKLALLLDNRRSGR
jgi:hypothetical protein